MPNDYHTQAQLGRTKRLRELQHELPDFCSDYFMAIEQQTSVLTRLSYAYDLKLFFQYLSSELPKFTGKPVTEFTPADIIPENFNSAKALWDMVCRLKG